VNINSEKMSKSLGNFFTIREILERYDSEVLRFFLLSAHYRSPIDFSDQNLADAEAGLDRIYSALAGVDDFLAKNASDTSEASSQSGNEAVEELTEKLSRLQDRFCEAMDDDFNTALAIAHIFDLARSLNRVLADKNIESIPMTPLFRQVKYEIATIAEVLGVLNTAPADYQARLKGRKSATLNIAVEKIEELVAERAAARKAKDFKRSDEIRNHLLELGIELLDGPAGTEWKVK
jgi:cysteinyl-tRNA synthetase